MQIMVWSILGIFVDAEEGPDEDSRVGEITKQVEE